MEKNKNKNLLAIILIIILLLIISIMGVYIWKLTNERSDKETQIVQLNNRVTILDNTLMNLEEKLENISNVVKNETNNTTESNNDNNKRIAVEEPEFSITLPESWKDKYEITTSSSGKEKWYNFIDKANKAYGGKILSIIIIGNDVESDLANNIKIELLKLNSNYKAYLNETEDVQFNDNNESLKKEYNEMIKEKQSIINTLILK